MQIIDGKKIRKEILDKIKKEVENLPFVPIFCDILVGENPMSMQYVNMKAKTAMSVGIHFHKAFFSSTITTSELVKEIEILNKMENMCGIIIQLPLPSSIDSRIALDAISPSLDVDFLGSVASKQFYDGNIQRGFPTAFACMTLLDSLNLDLKDKKIVVLGKGNLVGKPIASLLKFRGLNPTIITRKTPPCNADGVVIAGEENKESLIKEADIIISGIGKGKYIRGNMIKKDAILIDAGASEGNSGIVGDVDLESVSDIASFVSPVPGGVGPVTVTILLQNVLYVAKEIQGTPLDKIK